jgi:predicted ATP-binding protein involved in virulence
VTKAGGLRRITVRGLFGARDYEISLDASHPTVLTGANGTGKSTLLRLINAASSGNVATLASAPFTRLELHFEAMPSFIADRSNLDAELHLEWGPNRSVFKKPHIDPDLPAWANEALRSYWPSELDDDSVENVIREAAQAVKAPYGEFVRVRKTVQQITPHENYVPPDWFTTLQDQFPVLFITDQRLVTEQRQKAPGSPQSVSTRLAVEAASHQISHDMRRVDSDYARVSQQQDRRFPRDVIRAMSKRQTLPLEKLYALLTEVDRRRESLRAVGLLDADHHYEPQLASESLEEEQVRPVIATFLSSTLKKMAVLEDLANRLDAFKAFLDERFASKSLVLSRKDGATFLLESTKQGIRPSQLSSGEQQMFVLAYEILFRTKPGTLVLVDEPEISLHVVWQDTLIDHLQDMGRTSGLQFLLATHSPALLAPHPDFERSLDAVEA